MSENKLQAILTKEILEYEYTLLGSMNKIAKKFNISNASIRKYMKLYNIKYDRYCKPTYTCNHNLFSEKNEKSFYLAGFIAADGCLSLTNYSKLLRIKLSKNDEDFLEKLKKLFDTDVPTKEYTVKPSKLVPTTNFSVQFELISEKIVNDLEKFNIVPNKTLIYTFPKWIIDHPLCNHFMRGYFDGDGCIVVNKVRKKRKTAMKYFEMIGTFDFCEKYRDILVKNCAVNSLKITKKDSLFRIAYSGSQNIQSIYNFLYKDATIYLDRKRDKFIQH